MEEKESWGIAETTEEEKETGGNEVKKRMRKGGLRDGCSESGQTDEGESLGVVGGDEAQGMVAQIREQKKKERSLIPDCVTLTLTTDCILLATVRSNYIPDSCMHAAKSK